MQNEALESFVMVLKDNRCESQHNNTQCKQICWSDKLYLNVRTTGIAKTRCLIQLPVKPLIDSCNQQISIINFRDRKTHGLDESGHDDIYLQRIRVKRPEQQDSLGNRYDYQFKIFLESYQCKNRDICFSRSGSQKRRPLIITIVFAKLFYIF